MPWPRIDNRISFGNLLQIAFVIVALAAGWERFRSGIAAQSSLIGRVEMQVGGQEVRIRELEMTQARQAERLASIYSLLARIDSRLERMENPGGRGR